MKHHSKAAPVWLHGARLLFPPAATLLFLVLTEWIARGTLNADTFLQYIFPHAEAYLLAWGLLFLVWLALDWLTRFAPLATLLSALLGCLPATVDFYTLQLRGEPFLPWDLAQVSEAAGGLCGQHGGGLRPRLWRVFAACRYAGSGHPARCMDAGPLLPLLWRCHQLPHQPDESGDR